MIERLAYTQRLNYIPIYTSAQKTLPETNHIIIIMPMAKDTKKIFFTNLVTSGLKLITFNLKICAV